VKLPRISLKKGISLTEVKTLYPNLQVCSQVIAGKEYIQAQVSVPGVGLLIFIFSTLELLLEFEILPLQQE
jgi:hypothetical protein